MTCSSWYGGGVHAVDKSVAPYTAVLMLVGVLDVLMLLCSCPGLVRWCGAMDPATWT